MGRRRVIIRVMMLLVWSPQGMGHFCTLFYKMPKMPYWVMGQDPMHCIIASGADGNFVIKNKITKL